MQWRLTMLRSMLTDRFYCVLLSILSLLVVIITGIVLFGNNLQRLTPRGFILFSVLILLVVVTNLIFYRLLNERRYQLQGDKEEQVQRHAE